VEHDTLLTYDFTRRTINRHG